MGQGVRTPIWFVKEGDALYVWTDKHSGKAKRIRGAGMVKIFPATATGEPVDEWVDAHARADESPEAIKHIIPKTSLRSSFTARSEPEVLRQFILKSRRLK